MLVDFLQILATAIFMLIICIVTDYKFSKVPPALQPFYIGFALLAMGIAMGGDCGYGLNPVMKKISNNVVLRK